MTHTLPALPYDYNALEPFIDEETMRIHHTKHHQAYVDKLNAALAKHPELLDTSADKLITNLTVIPEDIRTAVRNHGGGHVNHSFFWEIMAQHAGGKPNGKLAEDIAHTFGSFEKFVEAFSAAALNRFGSGWAWLVVHHGKLEIISTANQDSPLSEGKIPILGLDVWEHAYYVKYRSARAEYVKNWWHVVNWKKVEEHYHNALTRH